jgi:(p)ppGpp synthase/HD superfamily hydrolase
VQFINQKQYSPDYDCALVVAAICHRVQLRKDSYVPYITHPIHVSRILELYGYPKHVVIAGVLHDVLEDTNFHDVATAAAFRHTFEFFSEKLPIKFDSELFQALLAGFIGERFGSTVLRLVELVTSRRVPNDTRTWRERKGEQMSHLNNMDSEHAALKGADLLHNMEAMSHNLEHSGTKPFACFHSETSLVDVPWYYFGSAEKVIAVLGMDCGLSNELAAVMARIRRFL